MGKQPKRDTSGISHMVSALDVVGKKLQREGCIALTVLTLKACLRCVTGRVTTRANITRLDAVNAIIGQGRTVYA